GLTDSLGLVYFCGPNREPKNSRTNNFFTLLYSPVFPINNTKKDTGRGPNSFPSNFPSFPSSPLDLISIHLTLLPESSIRHQIRSSLAEASLSVPISPRIVDSVCSRD
uniref:Uncharacterized protein n=1 Tax=Triticum urartu TaxID=4572 RepID=A0A8R7QDE3_TRIUA